MKTTNAPIRIGFCTDLTGPYQEVDGPAGAVAIQMAIEDMGNTVAGRPVEVLLGDHHNDVQEARSLAERWCTSDNVDMVISGVNSDTSLAITSVAARHVRPVMVVGAGTSIQTRKHSAPTIVQYAYNTVALATVPGQVLTRQGLERWFYVTADYPFGRELQEHGTAAVDKSGGTVVGAIRNPHGAKDFKPFLDRARSSNAQVLGLANGHAELLLAMAAMDQMGLANQMKLVGLLTFIGDIDKMGLERARGMYCADSWFWTRDTETRRWAEKFFSRQQRMPSSLQAADYSAATQYLRAVATVGDTEPQSVMRYLRSATLDDMYVRSGRIREDGTMLHDMHLLQVKTPQASTGAWDYYELVATVAGEDAFPLA